MNERFRPFDLTESSPLEEVRDGGWRQWKNINADLSAGLIDEERWHSEVAAVIRSVYLSATTPWGQSGRTADWEEGRRFILDAVDSGGSFLDCGCANGYLMESLKVWANEDGLDLEPYGLEIVPELASLARRRLPHWADRIWIGNVLHWKAPELFDYVRVGLEYVPTQRQHDLVRHLLSTAVHYRLIVGPYVEAVEERRVEGKLRSYGFEVCGRAQRPHRDPRVVERLCWIDRKPGL